MADWSTKWQIKLLTGRSQSLPLIINVAAFNSRWYLTRKQKALPGVCSPSFSWQRVSTVERWESGVRQIVPELTSDREAGVKGALTSCIIEVQKMRSVNEDKWNNIISFYESYKKSIWISARKHCRLGFSRIFFIFIYLFIYLFFLRKPISWVVFLQTLPQHQQTWSLNFSFINFRVNRYPPLYPLN